MRIVANQQIVYQFSCIYPSDKQFDPLFELLSSLIDTIIPSYPSADIIVFGDFKVHHTELLGFTKTDIQGRATRSFVISNSRIFCTFSAHFFPKTHLFKFGYQFLIIHALSKLDFYRALLLCFHM